MREISSVLRRNLIRKTNIQEKKNRVRYEVMHVGF